MDALSSWVAAPPRAMRQHRRIQHSAIAAPRRRTLSSRRLSVAASSQFNVAKVIATAWKISKDGIEAGAKLVPNSVPRPVARVSVAAAAAALVLFLIKSLVSTVLFVAAMMGLIYFAYMSLNSSDDDRGKSDDDRGKDGDDETLEEARRIMEKYK